MPSPADRPPVDFVVLGAMKAMTTSLLATLAEHPGVAVSEEKETQYFVAETGYRRGPAWYDAQFARALPGQVRGEASPQYTFFPVYAGVAERMAAAAPRARLVYLVRDPVDRAVSQWHHATARGVERRGLREALLLDTRYQLPSRYWLQLQQYLRLFPDEQLLVVDADRLARDPGAVLREVVSHVGADPAEAPTELAHLNAAEGRRQVRPGVARAREHAAGRLAERVARRAAPERWARLSTVEPVRDALAPDVADGLRQVFAADAAALRDYLGDAAPAWTG